MSQEERDALRIARRIEATWAARGYASVTCSVRRIEDAPRPSAGRPKPNVYEVRCNLVNGLPQDFRRDDFARLENE